MTPEAVMGLANGNVVEVGPRGGGGMGVTVGPTQTVWRLHDIGRRLGVEGLF